MSVGLYDKYTVIKNGSQDQDYEAEYFVLRIDKDPHAQKAALAYADSVKAENPHLAFDIYSRVSKHQKNQENG